MKKIKLPELKYFKANSKKVGPYDKFYTWVLSQVFPLSDILYGSSNPFDRAVDVTKIGLTEEDDNYLYELVVNWAVKYHKIPKSRVGSSAAMERLAYGPRVYLKYDYPDMESGYVYIVEPLFRDKNNF